MNLEKLGIEELLQKQMDRKEFLKHVSIAAVALTGVSALIKALLQHQSSAKPTTKSNVTQSFGYGSMPYGGSEK